MLQDTARQLHGRGRRDQEAAAPLARHRLQGRLRPRPVEAVRRAWPDRHLHPRKRRAAPAWARSRPALVLEEIGRNLTPSPFLTTAVAAVRALEARRRPSAGSPASSPARPSPRWRSTKAGITSPSGLRWRPSGRATASSSTAPSSSSSRAHRADMILVAARTGGIAGRDATASPCSRSTKARRASTVDNVALADSSQGRAADLRQCRSSMPTP